MCFIIIDNTKISNANTNNNSNNNGNNNSNSNSNKKPMQGVSREGAQTSLGLKLLGTVKHDVVKGSHDQITCLSCYVTTFLGIPISLLQM